ncbi:hypothetical protein JW877_08460 [bacterium]|nr:hypothetical protein [bacterium]
MEKVRYQHCPKCNSTNLKNIFYIKAGERPQVYVCCSECGTFVAKYILAQYISDQCYESLLEMMRGPFDSGRNVAKRIKTLCFNAREGFNQVMNLLEKQGEEQKYLEDILMESDSLESD